MIFDTSHIIQYHLREEQEKHILYSSRSRQHLLNMNDTIALVDGGAARSKTSIMLSQRRIFFVQVDAARRE